MDPSQQKAKSVAKNEPIEVSYTLFTVTEEGRKAILQKIATAINVQLSLETGQEIPFSDFHASRRHNKLFLYGPSGAGKSRSIVEIIRDDVCDFKKIYIINPRNQAARKSGRIDLADLADRFSEQDMVIWDNFPDDLVKRDIETARIVLEMISSRNVGKLLVALKPKYLEIYSGIFANVSELDSHGICYDREGIKKIIKSYGTVVKQFRQPYEKYIEQDIDRVSKILWQKDPLPITVLNYFRQLSAAENGAAQPVDGVMEAGKLLISTEFYEHQFELINNLRERKADGEFLYALKLCYELGLERTIDVIGPLQKGVFGTAASREQLRRLTAWIYLVGPYCSMHDACKEAIKFNDYVKLQIINFISANLAAVASKESNRLYMTGLFIGRNVQFLPRGESHPFLPSHVYKFMKNNRHFEKGLGEGIGESFPSLDDEIQGKILKRVELDIQFAEALGDILGRNFPLLEDSQRQQILKRVDTNIIFARYFGKSLGLVFAHLPKELQSQIFQRVEKNVQFADGLGIGLGSAYDALGKELQKEIYAKAATESEFNRGLGSGAGYIFPAKGPEFQKDWLGKAEKDAQFARGLGMGLGHSISFVPKELRVRIFANAEKNPEFAIGLGIGMGYNITYLDKELQREILAVERNIQFVRGLGLGTGVILEYLPKELQETLNVRARKNMHLDRGFGTGYGHNFPSFTKERRAQVYERAEKDAQFADGLGWGVSYGYGYMDHEQRSEIFTQIEKDAGFARGTGYGFAHGFTYLPEELQKEVLVRMDRNAQFAEGMG